MLTTLLALVLLQLSAIFIDAKPIKRATSSFDFYDLKTPLSGPCDLVEGPDGALWGQALLVNNIFRVDPSTGDVEEYPIPFTNPATGNPLTESGSIISQRTALSCAIRKGADGNLYAANGLRNQLVKIVPSTRKISVFTPTPYNPLGDLQPFNDLYSAQDGIYFTQTSGNVISFFDFATQGFKNRVVPTPASFPLGVYVTPDNTAVFAELLGNKMLSLQGSIDGPLKEYPLPELLQAPAVVRAQTSDGLIWYSLLLGDGVGSLDLTTGETKIYHTQRPGILGAENTIDSSGNIWLSFFNTNSLAKFNPATESFTFVEFPDTVISTPVADLPPYIDVAVTYGPSNAIWFTDISHNRVGRLSLD